LKCTTANYKKDSGMCACGFFLQKGLVWRQAEDQCYALGARLPEVKSPIENADILSVKVGIAYLHLLIRKCKQLAALNCEHFGTDRK
jgi:hypothetical protein